MKNIARNQRLCRVFKVTFGYSSSSPPPSPTPPPTSLPPRPPPPPPSRVVPPASTGESVRRVMPSPLGNDHTGTRSPQIPSFALLLIPHTFLLLLLLLQAPIIPAAAAAAAAASPQLLQQPPPSSGFADDSGGQPFKPRLVQLLLPHDHMRTDQNRSPANSIMFLGDQQAGLEDSYSSQQALPHTREIYSRRYRKRDPEANNGMSLSILNNMDVLRSKLLRELIQRRENIYHQSLINRNQDFLNSVG